MKKPNKLRVTRCVTGSVSIVAESHDQSCIVALAKAVLKTPWLESQIQRETTPELPKTRPEANGWRLVLVEAGQKKIAIIKEVRALTGLNLKDAKALVDRAPAVIRTDMSPDEASKAQAQIEKAGGIAKIEIV